MPSHSDDPVGYGRPPPGKRFEKGSSGNPRGRPKKAASLGQELNKALNERVDYKEKGQKKTTTKRAAAAKQLANASASGHLGAIKLAAQMAVQADPAAGLADTPLSDAEALIAERLVARIRFGWRKDNDT